MDVINGFFDEYGWVMLILFVLFVLVAFIATQDSATASGATPNTSWWDRFRNRLFVDSPAAMIPATAPGTTPHVGVPSLVAPVAPVPLTTALSILGVAPASAYSITQHLINGDGFQKGAVVRFRKSGQADLVAPNGLVVSDTELTFDAPPFPVDGRWEMVVRNPDGQEAIEQFRVV